MFLIKVLFHRGFFGPFLLLGFVKIPLNCLPINKVIAASAIFGIIIVTIRIQAIFSEFDNNLTSSIEPKCDN